MVDKSSWVIYGTDKRVDQCLTKIGSLNLKLLFFSTKFSTGIIAKFHCTILIKGLAIWGSRFTVLHA